MAASLPLAQSRWWSRGWLLALLLILGGAVTRLPGLWHPPNVVWDEEHFVNFAQGYLHGEYFFDIHPPLGKLLIAAALKAAGAQSLEQKLLSGFPYPPDYPYVAARLLPALAGSFLPLLVYGIGRKLQLSRKASFLAAMLTILDNALIGESRLALIDIFVPFLGFLAVFCFLIHRERQPQTILWWTWLALAALSAGLALSVKWTGGGMLLAIGAVLAGESRRGKPGKLPARLAVLGSVALAVYVSLFALHLALLPRSGPGDSFMPAAFRAALRASPEAEKDGLQPLSFARKFLMAHERMIGFGLNPTIRHEEESRFWSWPLGGKSISAWFDARDPARRIALSANHAVWLFGTLAVGGGFLYIALRSRHLRGLAAANETGWTERLGTLEVLLPAYLLNWLPFAAATRAMFLYHYSSALIVSLLAGSFLLFDLVPEVERALPPAAKVFSDKFLRFLYGAVLGLAIIVFLIRSPLTYGWRPIIF